MLEFALLSYYRSRGIQKTAKLSSFCYKLVNYAVSFIKSVVPHHEHDWLKRVAINALQLWRNECPNGKPNRDVYYRYAQEAERISQRLSSYRHVEREKTDFPSPGIQEVFILIARSNIHRPESYILPSTATQVVFIEQG